MRVQDREPKMEMQRARHGPENLGHMMQVRASTVSDSCNSYTRFENVPRLSDHLDHNNDDLSSPQKLESISHRRRTYNLSWLFAHNEIF